MSDYLYPWELHCCANPECRRKVKTAVYSNFCCPQCEEASGKYQLDDQPETHPQFRHSEGCDQRREERGEYSRSEAALSRDLL